MRGKSLEWETILLLLVFLAAVLWLGKILKQAGTELANKLRPLISFAQRHIWWSISTWWTCRTKRCDYYQVYQAYQALGAPELTHVGYHAGERLALEHFRRCEARNCEVCRDWAERLRGEFWRTLMDKSRESNSDTLETVRKKYGFQAELPERYAEGTQKGDRLEDP